MSRERVKETLTQYLRNPPPSYAFLLEGRWGVGKSHFWQQFRDKALRKLKRTDITLSVAGLSTLNDLEDTLFLASVKELGPDLVKDTCAVLWKTALRVMKVDPKDIKLRADVRSGKTVVCMDDIERFAGDFKVLFGFIKALLDDAELHVVLIGDEKRAIADLPGYKDYRERIINRSIVVPPDIPAVYESVVKGYAEQKIRNALLAIKDYAIGLFTDRGMGNLRTVRAVLDEVHALLEAMKWPEGKTPSIQNLMSAVTFHAMAVADDASNSGQVATIFMQQDLSKGLALWNSKKDGEGDDNPSKAWRRLVQRLGFGNEVYAWPNSYAFARYVSGDTLEAQEIAGDFQIFGDDPQEESLLKRLESYREMDDGTFDTCVAALRYQVENHELSSLHLIWMAYRNLSYLTRKKLTGWTEAACVSMFLTAIQTYDANGPVHPGMESFGEGMDDNDKKVWAALELLQAKIEAVEQAKIDEDDRNAIVEGNGNMPLRAGIAPFANANAKDIYARLKSAGRAGLIRMTRFYARRRQVANIVDAVKTEVPFAGALADLIDANKPKGKKVTLTEAAWTDLRDQLRGFVQWAG
jgi:hypothetical protein